MAMARTMLLHSSIHWGKASDTTLWPFAVTHSVWLVNRLPNVSTGLSTLDLWTRSRFMQSKFHLVHTWGCPAYILQKQIADGNKLGRWQPRSHCGQYLGISPTHSLTAPLVLNITTGSVTAQYNLTLDNWFTI